MSHIFIQNIGHFFRGQNRPPPPHIFFAPSYNIKNISSFT